MPHRRVVVAVVVAAALLVLAGCTPQGPKLASLGNTFFAIVASDSSSGMDAQIGGRVIVDPSGCFAINTTEDGIRSVLWPQGTFLDAHGINIPGFTGGPDQGATNQGDPIVAGGGELVADSDQPPCWDKGETIWAMAPESAEFGFIPGHGPGELGE